MPIYLIDEKEEVRQKLMFPFLGRNSLCAEYCISLPHRRTHGRTTKKPGWQARLLTRQHLITQHRGKVEKVIFGKERFWLNNAHATLCGSFWYVALV